MIAFMIVVMMAALAWMNYFLMDVAKDSQKRIKGIEKHLGIEENDL